jgi:hypothetical protein
MIEYQEGEFPKLEREDRVLLEYKTFGMEPTHYEKDIASQLVSILENTELPRFEVVEVTSTSNLKVKAKADAVFQVFPEDIVIPEKYRQGEALDFSKENLLEAPWVNLVHGWTKVLNYMNTISAIQKGEVEYDPQVMAAVTRELYLLTTASDPNPFLRTDERYSSGEFAETRMRRAGTKGVNSSRHVSYNEMKFILDTIEEKFRKSI